MLKKLALKTVLLATMILAMVSFAHAQAEHTLVISSWAPPTHGINAKMWPKFTEMVEEATNGRVTTELKLGIAPPPAQMDLVQDGAADLTILFHGYHPGRFVATKLIELPGYEGSAEAASVAYWRTHEAHLNTANEHEGVKLIALHTHGPAQLHSATKVTAIDQIDGMKIRIPGGVAGDVGDALGVAGIQVPAPKVYETLASNAADGVTMPMESRIGFKLTEVAQNVYEIPGGLYRGSFAFIMNEDAFANLPRDIQSVLESKVFGENLSREIGAIWDQIDTVGREGTVAAKDNAIHMASDKDLETYNKIAKRVQDSVLDEVSGAGIDAQAAYKMIKAEMAK